MGNDTLDIAEVATLLRRDLRDVRKLADRGELPGRKVGGQWRFTRVEIGHWLETRLHGFSDLELRDLDAAIGGPTADTTELLVTPLLSKDCVGVPLAARTKSSALRELVALAEQSWQVYDPTAVLEAIRVREELGSTAQAGGIAIPHPRRLPSNALGESVLAFGKTAGGIPFGATDGKLTDLFFLVLCDEPRLHLRVLARLARLWKQDGFADALRSAESSAEAWQIIAAAELTLIGAPTKPR